MLMAYIDPFSGSIVLQMILAGTLGGFALIRKWIWRVLRSIVGVGKAGG